MDDTHVDGFPRNTLQRQDRRDALKVAVGGVLGVVGAAATPLLTEAMCSRRASADVLTSATPPARCKHDKDYPSGQTCKHKKHHKGRCR